MNTEASARARRGRSPVAMLLVPIAVVLALTLYAWPSASLEPRDLPVAVAGPPDAVGAIDRQLSAQEGAFDVKAYPDEAAAREAIADRDVYGAFVATPGGAKLLTATAASPTVAQMLTQAAAGVDPRTQVEEAAPAPDAASGLSSSLLPIILAGSLTAAAAMALGSGALGRSGLVIAGSVVAGLAATAVIQSWLGIVEGDWFENAGAISLTVLAIAAIVAGLQSLFGQAGAVAGALTMIFVGNPWAGVNSSPEMLPQPIGAIGQLMPPGAGSNLLRGTGFFDGAAAGGHVTVLATWALAGLALLLASAVKARRPVPAPVPVSA
jgi:hypothetical protein